MHKFWTSSCISKPGVLEGGSVYSAGSSSTESPTAKTISLLSWLCRDLFACFAEAAVCILSLFRDIPDAWHAIFVQTQVFPRLVLARFVLSCPLRASGPGLKPLRKRLSKPLPSFIGASIICQPGFTNSGLSIVRWPVGSPRFKGCLKILIESCRLLLIFILLIN